MATVSRLGGLLADETGATAIEYALLAGFIATVIIGAVASLGMALESFYGDTNTELVSHMETPPAEPE
jgi:pilus assembly protein Flp/PilA